MTKMSRIDVNTLRKIISYDPGNGELRWKIKKGTKGKPGKLAGSIHKDHNTYYLRITINYKIYSGHHIAFAIHYGRWPGKLDHIDRDGLNNRILNLREATDSQNQFNRSKEITNTTGYKGVYNDRGAYVAQIYKYNKKYYLGRYKTVKEASEAYEAAAKRMHGKFARAA